MILWTAFLVGLLGSLHCIGMCGPITLALPVYQGHMVKLISSRFLYNTGRTITYIFMGAVIGLAGKGLSLAGIQQWLSVLAGSVLILIVSLPASVSGHIRLLKPANHFTSYLRKKFGGLLLRKNLLSVLGIGLINGFLPCGLVYVALTGALATGNLTHSMLYMALFGLGTIPLMFIFSMAGQFVHINIRRKFTKIVPVFIFVLGLLFILRGLNLGIPYISPVLNKDNTSEVSIHH